MLSGRQHYLQSIEFLLASIRLDYKLLVTVIIKLYFLDLHKYVEDIKYVWGKMLLWY